MRRVGHDINPAWLSMLSLVDIGSGLWQYAGKELAGQPHRRFFNDLEMMELGNGDFVAEDGPEALARARSHMTMWAIMKSPLVLSTNLSALGPLTARVATNPVALRINQDSLGAQARRVKSSAPAATRSGADLRAAIFAPASGGGSRSSHGGSADPRCDTRDAAAVAAPCRADRVTQRWRWARAVDATNAASTASTNGTLYTVDEAGQAWCLAMPTSGIWSVVPYTPGNATHPTACLDRGQSSSWRAEVAGHDATGHAGGGGGGGGVGMRAGPGSPIGLGPAGALERHGGSGAKGSRRRMTSARVHEYAFVWRNGNRRYGFAWGQDVGSSGPLPHTRWLQSNKGGNWVGDLAAAAEEGGAGTAFSPAGPVIDDDGVGGVTLQPGSRYCLDVVCSGNVETWSGPLWGGATAVAVLNRSPVQQEARVHFAEVGAGSMKNVTVRSAWGEPGVAREDSYTCSVPARGAALLVLEAGSGGGGRAP